MSLRYQFLFVLLIGLPACGGAGGSYERGPVEPTVDQDVELTEQQIAEERRLNEALARPEPNCTAACELGDSICDLATRICAIADRHRNDGEDEPGDRCEDANQRCERARERITSRCTCE